MQRWKWIVVGVILIALVAVGVIMLLPAEERTISAATSPDGSWSVAVVGTPYLMSDSCDVVVKIIRNARGEFLPGGFVVGLTANLEAAAKEHAVSFVDNNTAKVGNRTVEKPKSLRE